MTWNLHTLRRLTALLALALVVPALGGCNRPTGAVSGKVTYKGQPLKGGTVTFLGTNNKVASSPIQPDGTYAVTGVPVGDTKIAVTQPPSSSTVPKGRTMMDPSKMGGPSGAAAAPAADTGKPVMLPEKYNDANKSGVTYTVKTGKQEYDIDLK